VFVFSKKLTSAYELYHTNREWSWVEDDRSDNSHKDLQRQLWSYGNDQESQRFGLQEMFRNEESKHEKFKVTSPKSRNKQKPSISSFHITRVLSTTDMPKKKKKKGRKQYVPFNSMTLGQLFKKDTKEDQIDSKLQIKKEVASTPLPWWATHTNTRTKKPLTTRTPLTVTTTTTSNTTEAIRDAPEIKKSNEHKSNAVFGKEHSTNTIGKPINVTVGDVPTRLTNGLLVLYSGSGSKHTEITKNMGNAENGKKLPQNQGRRGESLENLSEEITTEEVNANDEVNEAGIAPFEWTEEKDIDTDEVYTTTILPKSKIPWLNWLASKSKLTTQKPTATTRFRSNNVPGPFQQLLLDKLEVPGPPIVLPTPKPTGMPPKRKSTAITSKPTASTTKSTSTDVPLWTWWTPESESEPGLVPASDLQQLLTGAYINDKQPWEQEDGKPLLDVINKETTEKMTTATYTPENTNSDNLESESLSELDESDTSKDKIEEFESGKLDISKEDDTEFLAISEDNHEDLNKKYLELVAHNTRLVDVLRSTLELQANLFRRIIRYLFP